MNTPRHTSPKRLGKVGSPNESGTPAFSDRQRRFLDAYREEPVIARAARLGHVNRKTVYRWRANAAFVQAMKTAAEAYFEAHRAKVLAAEAERARWREQRERERRPMRRYYSARARGGVPDGDWLPPNE